MIFQIEKSKIVYSNIYDEQYRDSFNKVREIYLREKIMEEYLFLKREESDKKKIAHNIIPQGLFAKNYFIENNNNNSNKDIYVTDKDKFDTKYEGVIIVNKENIFKEEQNVLWKYHLGHCFVLVCNKHENLQMALNFISILQLFLHKDNISKIDFLIPTIDILLPSGQLVFMTVEYAKHLMKHINI